MPLTELIRYFNAADHDSDSTLYAEDSRVAAWHGGLRLGSLFRPIVDLARNRIVGHEATLRIQNSAEFPVDRSSIYAGLESGPAIVHFDRLCRTLHALNFLAQRDRVGGYLQMAVHPRHLLAVPGQHGLVYEAILKRCGLAPEDIVLAVDPGADITDPHLQAALTSYRRRGYRLALSVPDDAAQREASIALRPDILRVSLTQASEVRPATQAAGSLLETAGIDTREDFDQALASGIALGSGNLFGDLQVNCMPTHETRGLAYNSPLQPGARHENRQ